MVADSSNDAAALGALPFLVALEARLDMMQNNAGTAKQCRLELSDIVDSGN